MRGGGDDGPREILVKDGLPARTVYKLELDADFAPINPSVEGTDAEATVEFSAEQYHALTAALGGTEGELGGGDARIGQHLRPFLNGMALEYETDNSDPNLYFYADIDGNGTRDLVRQGTKIEGLRAEGDGLYEIILMGEARNPGHRFTVDQLEDAPVIAATGPAFLAYGASCPDLIRSFGADAGALYRHFRDHGQAEGRSVTFDAAAWLASRPDVQAATGGDPWAALATFINYQRGEGQARRRGARGPPDRGLAQQGPRPCRP